MHANEGEEGGGGSGRRGWREGREMSVCLLIRVFVSYYWVKSRGSEGERGRERETDFWKMVIHWWDD